MNITHKTTNDNDINKLIKNLPIFIQKPLYQHSSKDQLIEIILDLGNRPEARFNNSSQYLSNKIISWQDIDYITKRISKFNNENRAGIEETLHRISCMRNRQFLINGLTCRIGRTIFGLVSVIQDLLELEKSILILGKPGIGKTTIIREIGRVLADDLDQRVIIIDTANEIAGDSDISHSGIGRARRMQVATTKFQHQIMIEAVENHMPQVIIIDEIGTEFEVLAARTIAQKGVQLIRTTHGNYLDNLIKNPLLSDLIGGIKYVTLSDNEAKRRGTQKSILERGSEPTFEIIIEINHQTLWTIHENVKNAVDLLLRNNFFIGQVRQFYLTEKIKIKCQNLKDKKNCFLTNHNNLINSYSRNYYSVNTITNYKSIKFNNRNFIIYPYSLSQNL